MSLVSLNVWEVVKTNWGADPIESIYFNPKPNNTYMIVFGPDQDKQLNFFNKRIKDKYNILYEAPRAYNKRYPLSGPRNTLFIFETKDEPATV